MCPSPPAAGEALPGPGPESPAAALDAFGAAGRPARECVAHLLALGYTPGQARNAVYRYRAARGLVRARRPASDTPPDPA